jgi:hypothetical protein
LISRLPETVDSDASPSSDWPASVPDRVTSAAGLSMSALPVAVSFKPAISRPAASMRSLVTVSDTSGVASAPFAVTARSTAPEVPCASSPTLPSRPVISASISWFAVCTLPEADNSPDEMEKGSAETMPSWSREISAVSSTRSASAGRSDAGSADDATPALSFSVTEPSTSDTSPVNLPDSALLPRLPSVTVSVSVVSVPASPALILPATSGAMVGLSMMSAAAVAVPVTGPLRAWMLKASECSAIARSSSSASLVATFDSVAAMSRFGSRPSPIARMDASRTIMSIGLSGVPNESGTPSPAAST